MAYTNGSQKNEIPQLTEEQIRELEQIRTSILGTCKEVATVRVMAYAKVWPLTQYAGGQFRNVTFRVPNCLGADGKPLNFAFSAKLWQDEATLVGDELARHEKRKFAIEFDPRDVSYRPYYNNKGEVQISWDLKQVAVYASLIMTMTMSAQEPEPEPEPADYGDHPF